MAFSKGIVWDWTTGHCSLRPWASLKPTLADVRYNVRCWNHSAKWESTHVRGSTQCILNCASWVYELSKSRAAFWCRPTYYCYSLQSLIHMAQFNGETKINIMEHEMFWASRPAEWIRRRTSNSRWRYLPFETSWLSSF